MTTLTGPINRKLALSAALAGIGATAVFDLFGLPLMQAWDIPALLGEKTDLGLLAGAAMHYGNGILLAIIYAALAPLFAGPHWLRAMTFITFQVVFGVWLFMLPLLGMGALGLNTPMGFMVPAFTLVRHWAYAGVLGLLYPALARRLA